MYLGLERGEHACCFDLFGERRRLLAAGAERLRELHSSRGSATGSDSPVPCVFRLFLQLHHSLGSVLKLRVVSYCFFTPRISRREVMALCKVYAHPPGEGDNNYLGPSCIVSSSHQVMVESISNNASGRNVPAHRIAMFSVIA